MIIATQCLALLVAPALGCSSPLLQVLDHQIPVAEAQRRGGGGGARAGGGGGARASGARGGGGARASGARAGGGARASAGGMNRPAAGRSPGNVRASSNGSINRSANANRNTNRNTNVNRNTNINNVNVHGGGGYYGGGGCYGCGWDNGGFGAGMVMGTMTGAMIGAAAADDNDTTVVYATGSVAPALPSGCTTVVVNGSTYQQCGSTWYQPQYSGSTVQYVVVDQP